MEKLGEEINWIVGWRASNGICFSQFTFNWRKRLYIVHDVLRCAHKYLSYAEHATSLFCLYAAAKQIPWNLFFLLLLVCFSAAYGTSGSESISCWTWIHGCTKSQCTGWKFTSFGWCQKWCTGHSAQTRNECQPHTGNISDAGEWHRCSVEKAWIGIATINLFSFFFLLQAFQPTGNQFSPVITAQPVSQVSVSSSLPLPLPGVSVSIANAIEKPAVSFPIRFNRIGLLADISFSVSIFSNKPNRLHNKMKLNQHKIKVSKPLRHRLRCRHRFRHKFKPRYNSNSKF